MAHVRLVEGASDTDKWGVKHVRGIMFNEPNANKLEYFRGNSRYEVVEHASQMTGRVRPRSKREREREANKALAAKEALEAKRLAEGTEAEDVEDTDPATDEVDSGDKKWTRDDFKVNTKRLLQLGEMEINEGMRKDTLIAIARDLAIDVAPEDTKRSLAKKIIDRQEIAMEVLAASGETVSDAE